MYSWRFHLPKWRQQSMTAMAATTNGTTNCPQGRPLRPCLRLQRFLRRASKRKLTSEMLWRKLRCHRHQPHIGHPLNWSRKPWGHLDHQLRRGAPPCLGILCLRLRLLQSTSHRAPHRLQSNTNRRPSSNSPSPSLLQSTSHRSPPDNYKKTQGSWLCQERERSTQQNQKHEAKLQEGQGHKNEEWCWPNRSAVLREDGLDSRRWTMHPGGGKAIFVVLLGQRKLKKSEKDWATRTMWATSKGSKNQTRRTFATKPSRTKICYW